MAVAATTTRDVPSGSRWVPPARARTDTAAVLGEAPNTVRRLRES